MKRKKTFKLKSLQRNTLSPEPTDSMECKGVDCEQPNPQPITEFRKIGSKHYTICKSCERKREQNKREQRNKEKNQFL